MLSIVHIIALELGVRESQVQPAVDLLDGGATVPFVARYRKEATGGLDDVALRALDTRLTYLRELQARREAIASAMDEQGKLTPSLRKALDTVYPHEPRKDWDGSLHVLRQLSLRHGVSLIAIGNGTASRETDKLAADLIAQMARAAQAAQGEDKPLVPEKVVVSEPGASVYSASEFASQEMPDVDESLHGAASIARRLQDPLAELVKIDPKSIGVGQYQHDVNQGELAHCLDAVVEDCVNAVGVDLNTASAPLLRRVSGLSPGVAASVVRWRDANGSFRSRQQLLQVTGLGAKTFVQSAGFLGA